MPPLITLTTDFGLDDAYVAAMKGVIFSVNPDARVIDISHGIRPHQIEQGAFILASARANFPPGTIHVAVVDPGVGTSRLPLAIAAPDAVFVGPDNGLLSAALPDEARTHAEGARPVPVPAALAAYSLADPAFHRLPVSDTFHGRDIFAPAAAHLSLGVPLHDLGPEVSEIVALPPFRAFPQPGGGLTARVVHVDRFGNVVTTLSREQATGNGVTAEIRGVRIKGLARTYAGAEGLIALFGSTGFLEIALSGASAAAKLGANIGDPVRITFL